MRISSLASLLFMVTTLSAEESYRDPKEGPLSPQESMKLMDLVPGWKIDLVASEPHVTDPVAMTWDEHGRLYVAEMGDYPTSETGGKVRLLIDKDRDGRIDSSTLFAEGLRFPNGLLPWNGGILVTAAPDILFLKDADGDGKAEHREVILTGFGEGNQQLRVNGILWSADGWVYGANGRNGGVIRSPRRPDQQPVNIDRHDFRFHPETGEVEAIAGFSQFGNAFNDQGDRFISWNTVPLRQVVFPLASAAKNPNFLLPNDCETLDDAVKGNRLFPRSGRPATFNREPAGYFNASCGIAIDRGGLFAPDDAGSAFACEPLFNIVHRRTLRPRGVTFDATRPKAEADREFLASRDPWFRPVFCTSGPDGSLYVADFYRQWVEHPDFVRADLREGVTWNAGQDKGRIYRIHPADKSPPKIADLSTATPVELVTYLGHSSGWCRDTALRLLREQKPASAIPLLKEAVRQHAEPIGRSMSLAAIESLGAIDDETHLSALMDRDPRVREWGVRLLPTNQLEKSVFRDALKGLAKDENVRVRFQTALVIAGMEANERIPLLVTMASISPSDSWLDDAILCSTGNETGTFLKEMAPSLKSDGGSTPRLLSLVERCATMVGARHEPGELTVFDAHLQNVSPDGVSDPAIASIAGLLAGLRQANQTIPVMLGNQSSDAWFTAARKTVLSDASLNIRECAARVLDSDPSTEATQALLSLLDVSQPAELLRAALRSLRRRPDPSVAEGVLKAWAAASPSLKREMLDLFFARKERLPLLIDAIEKGDVLWLELDPDTQRQLLAQAPLESRSKVEALLQKSAGADRTAVIKEYQPKVPAHGSIAKGAPLFAKHCAGCHRSGEVGAKVGPDLSGLLTKSRGQLIEDILDPNKQVLPDYIAISIVTDEGLVLSGLVAGESTTAVNLRRAEGLEETVPRERIESLRSTGRSLMPEGFEQSIPPEQMADLLSFLRQSEE